jgi:hypothetical protein
MSEEREEIVNINLTELIAEALNGEYFPCSPAIRIQRKRVKGWRMPENTVSVCLPGKWGNPFKIGGWFMMGDPIGGRPPMIWCEAFEGYQDERFTKIESAAQSVEWYARLLEKHPRKDIGELRGKNLACFCPLDQPCHADVLLELANEPQPKPPHPEQLNYE